MIKRLGAIAATVATIVTLVCAPAHAATSRYCGSPLSAAENQRVIERSDLRGTSSAPTFAILDDVTSRQRDIANILARHRDWRGLFAVGLDGVIADAIAPVQHDQRDLDDPRYSRTLSIDLVSRWLRVVHAEWTGGPVPPWWANYFTLATECGLPPARVAMAGYNAHITVDLAYTVAQAGSRPGNAHDFYRIVDTIAKNGDVIPARSKRIYGADLWGLWQFYFFGRGLDRIVGAGVASNLLLRAGDDGYNTLTFANGLALEQPGSHPAVDDEILALWRTGEVAFDVLSGIGGLGTPVARRGAAPQSITPSAPFHGREYTAARTI